MVATFHPKVITLMLVVGTLLLLHSSGRNTAFAMETSTHRGNDARMLKSSSKAKMSAKSKTEASSRNKSKSKMNVFGGKMTRGRKNPPMGPLTTFPTVTPSTFPSTKPSSFVLPSGAPSVAPTSSLVPTMTPSSFPSTEPSSSTFPSEKPSVAPTLSLVPTMTPSRFPTTEPSSSSFPSELPSIRPTSSLVPTEAPSSFPSTEPTSSLEPSFLPSVLPTDGHTALPTQDSDVPPFFSIDCGCDACTNQVLQAFAGSFRCGDRIQYVIDNANTILPQLANPTVQDACTFIAKEQPVCEPCACPTLYGVEWNGNLVVIDRRTGQVTQNLGSVGIDRINGAASDSSGQALVVRYLQDSGGDIYVIDPQLVAAAHLVALGGISPGYAPSALAIDAQDNVYVLLTPIMAHIGGFIDTLAVVDMNTGIVTEIGPTGAKYLQGMAFGASGVLYGYNNIPGQFGRFDLSTGAFTIVPGTSGIVSSIQALEFDPSANTLLGAGGSQICEFDTATGTATCVGGRPESFMDVRGLFFG